MRLMCRRKTFGTVDLRVRDSKPTISMTIQWISLIGLAIGMMSSDSLSIELPVKPLASLIDEEFSVREKAEAELLAWARDRREPAMEELYRQSRESDEPEVRQRCLSVLRELVNDDYLKTGEGYVGIMMQDVLFQVPGDKKLRNVIKVGQVIPDMAADQAGIKVDDMIVELNGEVWRDGPASVPFSGNIRKLKPGTKVSLKLIRDGEIKEIQLKLGKRPPDTAIFFPGSQVELQSLEKLGRDRFFQQWLDAKKVQQPD